METDPFVVVRGGKISLKMNKMRGNNILVSAAFVAIFGAVVPKSFAIIKKVRPLIGGLSWPTFREPSLMNVRIA